MYSNSVKIDRSFIKDLPRDRGNLAIVRAVLSIADSLGFSVTAEGVETNGEACALAGMPCDLMQGYLIGRPIVAAGLPAELARIAADHLLLPQQPDDASALIARAPATGMEQVQLTV